MTWMAMSTPARSSARKGVMATLALVSACGGTVSPNEPPASPISTSTLIAPISPAAPPQAAPPDAAAPSCQADSDCVVAIRTDVCCDCGTIYSRDQIKNEKDLAIYDGREGFWRDLNTALKPKCGNTLCKACPPPPSLGCFEGRCRAPRSSDEILRACSHCYGFAAQAAYRAGDRDKAIKLCGSDPRKGDCMQMLARMAIGAGKHAEGLELCRKEVQAGRAACLREAAGEIAGRDLAMGLDVCGEIPVGEQERDNCFQNMAMKLREKGDVDGALKLCQTMSPARAGDCKDVVKRYCEIYPDLEICAK